jgi:pseudaminic acid biosynthesis-associated methylase
MAKSNKKFNTDQEAFWAGDFGNEYIERNRSRHLVASKSRVFSCAISKCQRLTSVIEFGTNIGLNLMALRPLLPAAEFAGVEINKKAYNEAKSLGFPKMFNTSILDFKVDKQRDLAFTMGVLIHINPERLPDVYDKLYAASRRYILMCEYYNPTPLMVEYRSHGERLYKRDFPGEFLDRFKGTELVDYGFIYYRDPVFPLGDFTWFLMQKKSR